MVTIKGDPIKALSGLKLPVGAQVAIVSSKPESVREIRKSVRGRVARVTEVVEKGPAAIPAGENPVVDRTAFEPDARSRAMLEGIRIAQEDLRDAGGAYDLEQVRTLMRGVSRQAVDKRVQDGSLLAVPGPSNRRSYPTLQFSSDGTVIPGLKAVRDALQTSNPWMVLNFLSRPDSRLGNRRPIDLLKSGDLERVLDAARAESDQVASYPAALK
ncbi:hypothetical protein E4O86_05555 [Rhizobiales bacterium L72]|uniref:Antitoxin Xre/MbcA/ParS-like toxin-binding domain-containing protein n=2 Tax=Propylenella binzhouense TaxID=2555902 RepID=A0A964T2I5_9HYPH|nr:hypothetical protein [Propylenella binzhouense]